MSLCEIEIKSLLGSPERAEALRRALKELDPNVKLLSRHAQLNHYFEGGDARALPQALEAHLFEEDLKRLEEIVSRGKDFSVRTRQADDKLLVVVKASLDAGSSHNTVSRLEFEAEVKDLSLDRLDRLILKAGFRYQAKWSREREEYETRNIHVCLDKNAGYGYLAEFEKVVGDEAQAPAALHELRALMDALGAEELPQDRLERMFAHYNAHWPEYYGTEKIFTIE